MEECERHSKMGSKSNQLLFLSDFNQFPEGIRDSRSPDESSDIDSDVEGAIYAQMYFQDYFETGKSIQSRSPAPVRGSDPVSTLEGKTERSPDWSHDSFSISLLFSSSSETAEKKRKKKKKRKTRSADDRESSVKKHKRRSKNKPRPTTETPSSAPTSREIALREDAEAPLVEPLRGARPAQGGNNGGGFQDSFQEADLDIEESRCSAIKKSPRLQSALKPTKNDTAGKSTGSPLPDRVVNHDVVVVSSSSELSDTELYTLDEINIHGGPYCVDTSNVPTEDERGAVVISSEEDADSQVPLLRLAAEQSRAMKPEAPARGGDGARATSSGEEETTSDSDGGSGSEDSDSSSDGSEEGEVCSSDMELCSEKDEGSADTAADDKDLWHIIRKDIMGSEAYNKMVGLGGYHLKFKKCMNCKQKGHMARACPHPKRLLTCYLCGGLNHISSNCHLDLCPYCYHRKHRGRQTCHAFGVQCDRCYIGGHHISMCPDQWRQFHNTTHANSSLVRTHPREQRQNERVFCYNCAQQGHFGFECTRTLPRGWAPPQLPLIARYDAEWPDRRSSLKRGTSFTDAEPLSKRDKKIAARAVKREVKKQRRRNSMEPYDPRPSSLLGEPRMALLPSPNLPAHPLSESYIHSPFSSDHESPLLGHSSSSRRAFPRDPGLLSTNSSPQYVYPRDPRSPHSSSQYHLPTHSEGAEYDFPRTPLPRPRYPPHRALSDPHGHRGQRYSNHEDFTRDAFDHRPPHPSSDPLPPVSVSFHSSQSPQRPPTLNRRFSDISETRSSLARFGHKMEPSNKQFQTHNGQIFSERGFRGTEQTARLVNRMNHDLTQRRNSYRF